MALKKITRRFCFVALLLIVSAVQAENYSIKTLSDRTVVRFAEEWSFDQIEVPAVSQTFWGNRLTHSAATLKAGDKPFVSAISSGSSHMKFSLAGLITSEIEIIPLLTSEESEILAGDFLFSAVPATIRKIEQKINDSLDQEILFIRKNNCFSCHTALPLAMACKSAGAEGLQPDLQKIRDFGLAISKTQQPNGSFFYPAHPDYGVITTTLCAGVILAFLSDFSDDFISQLQNIFNLLPGWLDNNGLAQSDFYFKPVFIGQLTSALFESIIINTLYCKTAGTPQESHELMRQRLLRLSDWAAGQTAEPLHRQIILMTGMPYFYNVISTEKAALSRQLVGLLNDEPEGRRPEIQAIGSMVLKRLTPAADFSITPTGIPASAKNWQLFLELLQLFPVKAKNTQQSADNNANE